ncbi:MAG TPA: cation-translocating P-type ATPase [Spirochaetales bacterium]|nr:cation-translocating P-type ATPase [Spirochaetales bacterium]
MEAWHGKTIDEALSALGSDRERGLEVEEAKRRLERYGPNRLTAKKPKSLARRLLEQFQDYLIYILMAAAAISVLLGEVSDAIIILLVVVINAVVGVVQESKAEKAIEALKKLSAPRAIAVREGQTLELDAAEIVPGDIVLVDAGRVVPCDLRWIEAVNLKIEEASLTGESVPVEKDASLVAGADASLGDRLNMGYASTVATYGRGRGLAVATGMGTELGRIAAMLEAEPEEETPLQRKLDDFGKKLGTAILVLCGLIFLLGVGEELLRHGAIKEGTLFELFLTAVSLAVAAIPEGLAAIVTIVLAIGVQLMSREKAIIRRLPSVETLGSVTMICSDKTGTLTRNKMSVVAFEADGASGSAAALDLERPAQRLLVEAMALCNDACLGAACSDGTTAASTGDPTEIALLELAEGHGIGPAALLAEAPRVGELPFDSDRKMMSTAHERGGKRFVATKGAVDRILERCDRYFRGGEELPLDAAARAAILSSVEDMARRALRVLGAAYRPLGPGEAGSGEGLERGLCYIGAVGMIDPPRLEVRDSIASCAASGIGVAMITGDHKLTALAIGRELGIATGEDQALSGAEIDGLDDAALAEKARTVRVFARVSPEHKVRIVKAFRSLGHIVSMTGDGVNDAPSLKAADIGVAMGITGTDVAKGASDMILADDNFATIVRAIEEGRNIYNNIKKAVYYLLSCNAGEIVTVLAAVLAGFPIPLLPIHILWINLVTDTFPALALGMDPGDPKVIYERPRDPRESLFARGGFRFLVLNGLVIGGLSLGCFFLGQYRAGIEGLAGEEALTLARTMAFATLSLSQLFHAFNLRHPTRSVFSLGLLSNPYLVGAFVLGFALQGVVITLPGLASFFKVATLGAGDWLIVLAFSAFALAINELAKLLRRLASSRR